MAARSLKMMLSQRAFSSNLLAAQSVKELLLGRAHFSRVSRIPIVESLQMEETMNNVELYLADHSASESARVAERGFRAYENFTVLKSQHVSRTCFVPESAVQRRHSSVGNYQNQNLVQLREIDFPFLRQTRGTGHGLSSKLFQLDSAKRDFALQIANLNDWDRLNLRLHRDRRRSSSSLRSR